MKLINIGMIACCLLLLTQVVYAQETHLFVGAKGWYADADQVDPGFLWGPTVAFNVGAKFRVFGMFLTSTFEGQNSYGKWETSSRDADLVAAYSWKMFEGGLGCRYSTWIKHFEMPNYDYRNEDELEIYGPMIHIGASNMFGKSRFGWYTALSYMFLDLGTDKNLEHYNIEGGLRANIWRLAVTLGYRYKDYYNADLAFKGIVANLAYRVF